MADGNDFEVAPTGTRALLREVAATLREYEAGHRAKAQVAAADLLETDRSAMRSQDRDRMNGATAKADRNARLAGKVEATLLGWEG